MSNARIKFRPLYFGGDKFAELHTGSTAINSGDEAQFGADGYLGHSDGAIMTKISGTAVVPVTGTRIDVLGLLKSKAYIGVGQFIGGQWIEVSMRCLSATFDGDRKAGKMEGKFEFEGGEPDVV